MPAVAMAHEAPPVSAAASDGWRPPGGYDNCNPWALDNRAALEAYALGIEQYGTAAEQLERWCVETAIDSMLPGP